MRNASAKIVSFTSGDMEGDKESDSGMIFAPTASSDALDKAERAKKLQGKRMSEFLPRRVSVGKQNLAHRFTQQTAQKNIRQRMTARPEASFDRLLNEDV